MNQQPGRKFRTLDEVWGVTEEQIEELEKFVTSSKTHNWEEEPKASTDLPRKREWGIQTSWQHMYKGDTI